MSNLSTYYSFNQPDVNLNGQIQNWVTGSPVYDASLNGGAYISSQNYKTGNGSLEFPKNNITQVGTLTTTANMTISLICITGDELTMIGCNVGTLGVSGGLTYYQTRANKTIPFTNNSWTTTHVNDTITRNYYGIAVTFDGSKFVTCVYNGYIYYATKSGDAGYNTLTQVTDTPRNYQGIAMTKDGNTIVASAEYQGIYFANWNAINSNYNAFTRTLEQSTSRYYGIGISSNGDRIVYANINDNTRYLSFWNGSNYNKGTLIYSLSPSNGDNVRTCCFNDDSSILFLSYRNKSVEYGKYNNKSNSYDTFTTISSMPNNKDNLSISCIDTSGGKCTIYTNSNFGSPIYYCDLSYNTTITNYCTIQPPIIDNRGLTFACWFRSNYNSSGASYNVKIFDFGTSLTATIDVIRLVVTDNYLRLVVQINTTSYRMEISGNYINDNKWYHTAITISYSATPNNSTITAYINGSVANTFTDKPYPVITSRPYCYLGKAGIPVSDQQFFGNIDDFRVYNSELTDSEILTLYNNTNVKNNYKNSNISVLYTTPAESASTPITPRPTTSNVGSSKTYYYWNDPYAATNTIINKANPYNFYYTYDNTSQYQNAKVSVVTSDLVTLKLNGVIQTNLLDSGSIYGASAVTLQQKLVTGNNLFEFITYNNSGPAYFAAYVTDTNSTPNYLFSTNFEKTGWNVKITGLYSGVYPVSSLLVNDSTSTPYTTASAITTATNYKTFGTDLSSNRSCKRIKTFDMNFKTSNNNLANIFFSYP
jgi:hypothetical protein